jgi:cation:H+ antiporter
VLVVAVLAVAIMATQLPGDLVVWRIGPGALAVAAVWVVGLWLVAKARGGLPWKVDESPEDRQPPAKTKDDTSNSGSSTGRAAIVFVVAAVATLIGGVVLERAGNRIAGNVGISGVLFAATFLAGATALPEISTGLRAIEIGDERMAVSEIFGGNAFLPVLFVEASLISGAAVLPRAQDTDIYLAALGALLTAIYLVGLVFRTRRQVWRLGVDSWVVTLTYAAGIIGLAAVAHK